MAPLDDAFPPRSWLGFGLDMTSVTPTDITSVTKAVLKANRIIQFATTSSDQTADKVTWTIPDNVDFASDVNSGTSSYDHFENGTKAANAIRADATLSAKYMAVSGDASMDYSITKTFNSSVQYSMFSFNQNRLEVSFEDWSSNINNLAIKNRLRTIDPFDPNKPDIVDSYRSLFRTMGSHIITGTNYGARLQLHVRCENSDSSVNQSFAVNLSVAYDGLTTKGKVDTSVSGSDEYKTFSNNVQKTCSCMGGDVQMATVISSNTASDDELYSSYQEWIKTVQEEPGIMSMQLMTLWDVMASSDDEDVAKRNPDVQHAYQWVVSHPQEHWTKCRFVINSDWGEIGLLTPSAIILPDPEHPVDPSVLANTNFATTKITWGKEQSHSFQRDVTIDFIISNDGSPVDIELSHGSDGDSGGSGRCQVKFANSTDPYINEGVKGNNWNTQWFYQCEVSSDIHVSTEDDQKQQQNGHAK